MKSVNYYLLDVFTNQPFSGNPLAVFLEAGALDTRTMQSLANELNLAETVFLSAPTAPDHYPMRIFTPTRELPFAGHPTIGSAHLLAELNLVKPDRPLVLQPAIGELTVRYHQDRATFTTAQPVMIKESTIDRITAVELLGLDIHQVMGDPVIASYGLPYHLIELANQHALESVNISSAHWMESVPFSAAEQIYLYVVEQQNREEMQVRSRMFCMHGSICEDPATGSAAAALTGYLASLRRDALQCQIHQGGEMGRPSVIHTAANGEIKPGLATVGGSAVLVGKGEVYVTG